MRGRGRCGDKRSSLIRRHRPLPAGQRRGAGPGRAAPLPALSGGGGARPLCAARSAPAVLRLAPVLLRSAPATDAAAEGIGGSARLRPAAGLPRLPLRPAAALPRLAPLPPVRATRRRLRGPPVSPPCALPPGAPPRRGWRGWQRPCAPEAEGRARRRRGRRRKRRRRRDEALPPWGRAAALAAVGGEVGREGSAALRRLWQPRVHPAGVRHRSRPGTARRVEGSCSRHPAGGRVREVIYFGVNVFAGTGLAPHAVHGQECGGAAGPGWARPGAAAGAVVTGVRGRRARRVSEVLRLEQRKIVRGVMEQGSTAPVRRGTSCWKLPVPSRLADCPGDTKPAPVSKG